jgi:hypothetical protein
MLDPLSHIDKHLINQHSYSKGIAAIVYISQGTSAARACHAGTPAACVLVRTRYTAGPCACDTTLASNFEALLITFVTRCATAIKNAPPRHVDSALPAVATLTLSVLAQHGMLRIATPGVNSTPCTFKGISTGARVGSRVSLICAAATKPVQAVPKHAGCWLRITICIQGHKKSHTLATRADGGSETQSNEAAAKATQPRVRWRLTLASTRCHL